MLKRELKQTSEKQKRTSINKIEMIISMLEKETKRKVCPLQRRVVSWVEKEAHKNLRTQIKASEVPFALTRRARREESCPKPSIIHFTDGKQKSYPI